MKHKVLFVTEAVTLAHIARPFMLSQHLDLDSHEVYFATDKAYRFILEDSGYHILPLHSVQPKAFLQSLKSGKWLYDHPRLSKYVKEELALIDAIQPDVIIGDLRYSLGVSAQVAGIPYVNITNAYWSPYAAKRHWPVACYDFVKVLGLPLSNLLFRGMKPLLFGYNNSQINKVCRDYMIEPFPDFATAFTFGDVTLYADIPTLVPTPGAPENHVYIGPLDWSPSQTANIHFNEWKNDLPIAYLSLGSSGDIDTTTLIVETLLQHEMNILIATAGRYHVSIESDRIRQFDFVPGDLAARHARFVICNGGSPTTYQSLREGTPVLGIPSNLDQFLAMENIVSMGAGIGLRADKIIPKGLHEAITLLRSEKRFQIAAQKIQRDIEGLNTRDTFLRTLHSQIKLDNYVQKSAIFS